MFTLDRTKNTERFGSNFALAIALMSGTAVLAGALEAPAQAQKRDKKKKGKAPKADYSKEFIAAYTPVNELTKGLVPDVEAAKAGIPSVIAAASTPDDKMATGGLVFNIGVSAKDTAMQRQGYDMMIDSGRVAEAELGKYFYNAGQLAYADDDYDTARSRFLQASEAGYAVPDLENTISGLYFMQDRYPEGLAYLKGVVGTTVANGQKPAESVIVRAFSAAYNNDLQDEALAWTVQHVEHYPTEANWVNVIALRREYFDEDPRKILDLLRLQDRAIGLKNDRDYINYVEVSNVRFPAELKRVVDEGVQKGVLQANSVVVQEARDNLSARVSGVREDITGLEADARRPNAKVGLVTAAADVFLSLGNAAKAEEMFALALGKAGGDTDYLTTRMGIAQVDQGKGAEAKATFAKVTGSYKSVAELWAVYAGQLSAPAPVAAVSADTTM